MSSPKMFNINYMITRHLSFMSEFTSSDIGGERFVAKTATYAGINPCSKIIKKLYNDTIVKAVLPYMI